MLIVWYGLGLECSLQNYAEIFSFLYKTYYFVSYRLEKEIA